MRHWETISPLIAALYEAAVYPSLWESVLTQLCAAVEFESAFLFSSDGRSQSSVVTPSGKDVFSKFLAGGWQEKNERMHRMLAKGQHGFVHDYDVFSPDEIDKMPIYRDFLHPLGLGFGAGTFVQSPRDNQMILSLERRRERGLVDPETIQILDMIRPHLARAVMLTIEVHKRQAELTLSGLTMVGIPAAVISDSGRLVATNALFVDLESQLYFQAFDQVRLRDRRADQLFRISLLTVGSDADTAVRSIPLPGSDTHPASVIHILPLRNEARGFSSHGAAILFVSQARNDDDEPHSLLRGLYDLSNAEAKLAACILRGQDLRQASSSLGIKYETARKVSKAVYMKTGSTGQADLIRRVSFVQRI
jgi:DNA-binding CsgD family transcriptional regulator